MSDYFNFQKCLKIGQVFEKKAQQKIMNYYKNKYHVVHENDTYEYDFMLSNDKYYEVKYCSSLILFLETYSNHSGSSLLYVYKAILGWLCVSKGS